jgi:enoyl-CoA hydratase/carnithine racemase
VIDHPPLNLFDAQMVSDILAGLDQAGDCRALLVRAEGRYFTGGVDVNEFKGLSESDGARLTADLLAITHRIETLPFPTLASVHGLCLTGRPRAYDAATLERWNVVNRVLPDAELAQKSLRFAQRLAAGPTKRPPRHEAHRARVPGARCARRRRRDRRDRGAAVRDGRPTAGGGELPGGRARKGDVQGLLTPFRRPPLVALRRQCRRKPT